MSLGYNGLTWPGQPGKPNPLFVAWWMFWPEAEGFQAILAQTLPEAVARQTWHVMGTLGFTLFQVVGIPLTAAAAWTTRHDARTRWPLFCGLMLWMTVVSVLGAMYLDMGVQSYDLAGQMLLHICWYLFPALSIALWSGFHWLAERRGWHTQSWIGPAVVVVCCAIIFQVVRGPSSLEKLCSDTGFTLSADEWEAFSFLRHKTPPEAVVLMPLRPPQSLLPDDPLAELRRVVEMKNFAICGAFSGRAVFIEYAHGAEDVKKVLSLMNLWKTTDIGEFARGILSTGVDYMIEYPIASPAVFQKGIPEFLNLAWESQPGSEHVRIWQIDRPNAAVCGTQASSREPLPRPSRQD